MGTFCFKMEVAPAQGGAFEEVEALVDTGATYTWMPHSLLDRLGILPEEQHPFALANGRTAEYPVAQVRVRLDGRTRYTVCIFGDEGTQPLLEAVTLKEFGLGVDPVNQRLVPVPGLLKKLRGSL